MAADITQPEEVELHSARVVGGHEAPRQHYPRERSRSGTAAAAAAVG